MAIFMYNISLKTPLGLCKIPPQSIKRQWTINCSGVALCLMLIKEDRSINMYIFQFLVLSLFLSSRLKVFIAEILSFLIRFISKDFTTLRLMWMGECPCSSVHLFLLYRNVINLCTFIIYSAILVNLFIIPRSCLI